MSILSASQVDYQSVVVWTQAGGAQHDLVSSICVILPGTMGIQEPSANPLSVGTHWRAIESGTTLEGNPGIDSTQAASWTFGVGNDWDSATARTLAGGQMLQHEWTDTSTGDTLWLQSVLVAGAGSVVNIADVGPITDRWNLGDRLQQCVWAAASAAAGASSGAPNLQLTDSDWSKLA